MRAAHERVGADQVVGAGRWDAVTRSLWLLILGFAAFAIVLLAFGKDPVRAYVDIFSSTLASWYGFSETLVKMTPLVLAAVAVAVPGRIWLINVGGEGQLHVGAIFATWGALTFGDWPGFAAAAGR